MNDSARTPIVGFDLGHGETALARAYAGTTDAPQVLQIPGSGLPGGRQCVTAVSEMPDGSVLIGDNAMGTRGGRLYLAFKGPALKDEQVRHPVRLFTGEIRTSLVGAADLPPNGAVRWVFGSPSGWPPALRAEYAALFRAAGFANTEVVPESRAAMLYARDSGEVPIDPAALNGDVLIVDLGSSTVDFTAVVRRQQRNLRQPDGRKMELHDRGTNLGASLIEREIMERVLREHPRQQDLEDALASDQNARLRLELLCRKAKEDYFRQGAENPASDSTVIRADRFDTPRGRVLVDVELTKADMDGVLDTPLPAIGDRTWRQAFREDLQAAAAELGGAPDAVLLTGGASRMPFVLQIAREMFGAERVQRGAEPEAAIARGLAIAGRISVHTEGFTREVQELLNSGKVRELVEQRLPDLAQRVGAAAAESLTERHVIPAFRRWRNGDITTLNAMAAEIARDLAAELGQPDNPAVVTTVSTWQNGLKPQLEELTRPICNRWHLPPTALTLAATDISQQSWNIAPLDRSAPATDFIENLAGGIAVIVAAALSTLLFGHGVALIATTGPVGWLIGFLATLLVLRYGKDKAEKKAKEKIEKVNLPGWVRRGIGREEKILAKLRAGAKDQEAELGRALADQFLKESGPQLVVDISTALELQLEALAAEAKFLIE